MAQFVDDLNDYVFQEERSEEGTIHLQSVMRFKNPVGMGFQERYCQRIHWERCRNWRKSVKYCSKRDTKVGEVHTNIKGLVIRKRIRDPMEGLDWYQWENDIIEIINEEPDNRKIYWFWESYGCTGKSTFCKHLVMNYGAVVVGGRVQDAMYALINTLEDRDVNIVVFDIPRSFDRGISYESIENIKNGIFFSAKYESRSVVFNSPHVIVFSNEEPDYARMSLDRWVVREI